MKPFKSTYSFSPLGVGDSAFSFQSCYELANSLSSINNCPSWNNISETKELSMLKKVEYEKPPPLHESPAVQRETLPQYWGTEGLTSAETNNITDTMATRDNAWWNVGPFLKVMFLRPARVSPPHLSSLSLTHTFTYTYILKFVRHMRKKKVTYMERTSGKNFPLNYFAKSKAINCDFSIMFQFLKIAKRNQFISTNSDIIKAYTLLIYIYKIWIRTIGLGFPSKITA